MVYNHLFVDSDVLLDLLLNREPFDAHTKLLILESKSKNIKLSTSTLVIANINYILSKKLGIPASKEGIKNLINIINILPFEPDVLDLSLVSKITDFEDAIQENIAKRYNCQAIITRNIRDYKHSSLPVYNTEQYLNS